MNRESDKADARGFAQGGAEYIETYSASMTETGWGPRSCEITEAGREILSEVSDKFQTGLDVVPGDGEFIEEERVAEIEAEIERLDNQFATLGDRLGEISDQLEQIQNNEFGGVDSETTEKIEAVMDAMVTFNNFFRFVFAADVEDLHPVKGGKIKSERIANHREQIYDALESQSPAEAQATIDRKRNSTPANTDAGDD